MSVNNSLIHILKKFLDEPNGRAKRNLRDKSLKTTAAYYYFPFSELTHLL